MNVFDYLNWRDDIEFDSLNELDILIFNRLAYLPFEKIIVGSERLTIEDTYERSLKFSDLHYSNINDKKLFKILAKSYRYKDLIISNVVNKFDKEKEEQFLAITINLPKNHLYIAFRGTTSNIVGWKENFNMSYLDETPAQKDAKDYINKVSPLKKLYIGGHSKGGNLAMYAAAYSNPGIKKRIIKVYNYDGPGFMTLNQNYYSIKNKIVSYIPSNSVVGRLLNLDNETIVVKSTAKKILQHNVYTWEVEKNFLIRTTLEEESNTLKNIIDEWLNKMDKKARQEFVDNLYKIINSTNIEYTDQLNISDLKEIILSYKNMDSATKKLLLKVIGYLFDSAKNNIDL